MKKILLLLTIALALGACDKKPLEEKEEDVKVEKGSESAFVFNISDISKIVNTSFSAMEKRVKSHIVGEPENLLGEKKITFSGTDKKGILLLCKITGFNDGVVKDLSIAPISSEKKEEHFTFFARAIEECLASYDDGEYVHINGKRAKTPSGKGLTAKEMLEEIKKEPRKAATQNIAMAFVTKNKEIMIAVTYSHGVALVLAKTS